MMRRFLWLLCFMVISSPSVAREPKEYDRDVIYDEEQVPAYDLPPLLVTPDGEPVETPERWFGVRRPQIIALFSNLVYGRVPAPETPITMRAEVVKKDSRFLGGEATRKEVRIRFENVRGTAQMHILVFVPNDAAHALPALLVYSFDDTRGEKFALDPEHPGRFMNGWPVGEMLRRGYGLVVMYQQDLVKHNDVDFLDGIHSLFYREGQSFPKASEWGVLAAVAWGGSRVLDYLAEDSDIDASRVAVMGHSKMGKAALWTGAQDERFAMVISAQSGCAGAALWRRKSGETLEKMVTRFPYWLCRNAWKFVNTEDDLPVDQHMLLACIAPRPLYVHSAIDDTWADPRGEYLSALHASAVYRLLGKKGLEDEASPPVNHAILDSDVGYHLREGGHAVEIFDWMRFLDFADRHLKTGGEVN